MADDNVVRFGSSGNGPGSRVTQTPPRQPRIRPWGVAMDHRILSVYNREELTPPDALGDQFMPPSWIGVRDRAVCVLYGQSTPPINADNDRT